MMNRIASTSVRTTRGTSIFVRPEPPSSAQPSPSSAATSGARGSRTATQTSARIAPALIHWAVRQLMTHRTPAR